MKVPQKPEEVQLLRTEYRVVWQRRGWRHTKSRTLGTWPAVQRLVDRLEAPGRPDLKPLTFLGVDERPVGEWVRTLHLVEEELPRW